MKTEMWPIERLKAYDQNPRNNDAAVEPLARAIKEFGFRQPIVVTPEGVIICGHTRYKASLKLGLTEVPVHVATDLTPTQIKAYRIADNRLADIATWNYEILPIELAELFAMDVDPELLGDVKNEWAKMLDTMVRDGLADPNDVPEPPDEAVTQPGDLWILGNHRLLCADSGNPEHVDRLLDGNTIQLVNTDPPYNVRVEPRSKAAIAAGNSSFASYQQHADGKKQADHLPKKLRAKDRPLKNDFVSDEEFDRLLRAWFGNIARVLEPGRSFYVWGGYANLENYPPAMTDCDMFFSQVVCWRKMHPVLTRKDMMGCFELAFYGWRKGAAHQFFGPNNATDLWEIKKINPQQMEHLTQKPVELATRAMQYSSRPGENVLDLFGGSGSTLIGAEQTGRKAFLMELDPLYCDVIADRFQRFSGTPAILERTGTSPLPMKPLEANMR